MSSILNSGRSTKDGLFYVGDLIMSRAATDAYGNPWIGVITEKAVLTDSRGNQTTQYRVHWMEEEANESLWPTWYDEDMTLVQPGQHC